MTIEANTAEFSYIGDGVTKTFSFPAAYSTLGDIIVGVNGVEITSGFTAVAVTGGANITFSIAPLTGSKIVLLRRPAASQLTSFLTGAAVLETTLDKALDKLTMLIQFLFRRSDRSLRFDDLSVGDGSAVLPAKGSRAGRVLGFGAGGELTTYTPEAAAVTVTGMRMFGSTAQLGLAAPNPAEIAFVAGNQAPGDGGHGMFFYDVADAKPADGFVHVAPLVPYVGRWRLLYDGLLPASKFGLIDHATLDQSGRVQNWFASAVAEKAEAYFDIGGEGRLDCNGAAIYINDGGSAAGAPLHGFTLRTKSRRWTNLKNCWLEIGARGAFGGDGLASGTIVIEDLFIEGGGIFLWSLENASTLRNVRVWPGVACLNRTFDNTLKGGTGIAQIGGVGIGAFGCNGLIFQNVRAENPVVSIPADTMQYVGARFDGCSNFTWLVGAGDQVKNGVVFGRFGLTESTFSSTVRLVGVETESTREEALVIEEGRGFHISSFFRASNTVKHGPWDSTKPLVRVGVDGGSFTPSNINFIGSYFVGIASPIAGTALQVARAGLVSIYNNNFLNFERGWEVLAAGDRIDIGPNEFTSVTNEGDIVQTAVDSALRTFRAAKWESPVTLADNPNLDWNAGANPQFEVSLGAPTARAFLAPRNLRKGNTYRGTITKTLAGANISTWDAVFAFPGGTPPNILAMTTTQRCFIECYYDGTVLICTTRIV